MSARIRLAVTAAAGLLLTGSVTVPYTRLPPRSPRTARAAVAPGRARRPPAATVMRAPSAAPQRSVRCSNCGTAPPVVRRGCVSPVRGPVTVSRRGTRAVLPAGTPRATRRGWPPAGPPRTPPWSTTRGSRPGPVWNGATATSCARRGTDPPGTETGLSVPSSGGGGPAAGGECCRVPGRLTSRHNPQAQSTPHVEEYRPVQHGAPDGPGCRQAPEPAVSISRRVCPVTEICRASAPFVAAYPFVTLPRDCCNSEQPPSCVT